MLSSSHTCPGEMTSGGKTPVTVLQEYLQKKSQIPTYNLVFNGAGSHEPQFKYEVVVGQQIAVGDGKSKKEAKHNAAKMMVEMLIGKEEPEGEIIQSPYADVVKENAVGALQDYCTSLNLGCPTYDLTRDEGLSHAKIFCMKVTVSSLSEQAEARTKKQAKQLAASKLIKRLKDCLDDILPRGDEVPVVFADKFEEVNELAKLKLAETSSTLKKRTPFRNELLGLSIADYHKVFRESSFPSSPTLESIKGLSKDDVQALPNPRQTFDSIMRELCFEYELEYITSVNIREINAVLVMETSPSWSFCGIGETKDEAATSSFCEGLAFLAVMSS